MEKSGIQAIRLIDLADYQEGSIEFQERNDAKVYGKERPLDPGHNEEAWAKNRRDHFVILSK